MHNRQVLNKKLSDIRTSKADQATLLKSTEESLEKTLAELGKQKLKTTDVQTVLDQVSGQYNALKNDINTDKSTIKNLREHMVETDAKMSDLK